MNSQGGSIFWGIRNNDRQVIGLTLSYVDRDNIRKALWNKLIEIQPAIDPSAFKIHFHEVFNNFEQPIDDLFVLEVMIPKMDGKTLYFTGGNEAFMRVDGIKKKLIGPKIQDWILRRNRVPPL